MVVKARSSCTVSPRFLVVYYMTYRMATPLRYISLLRVGVAEALTSHLSRL